MGYTYGVLLCFSLFRRGVFNQFNTTPLHIVLLLSYVLTLTVLVTTIDAQWEGMGDVGSARYEPALLPPCPTIRVLNYSN